MSQSGRTPPTRKERRATERSTSRTSPASAAQPAWKSPIALVSIGAVIVGLVVIVLLVMSQSKSGGTAVKTVSVGVPEELRDGRSLGAADAPVVIDLYEDPQCPVCGRFNRDIAPLLMASSIKDGTVRLNYKDFTFIGVPGESQDAAVGMRAAEQLAGKFWDFHDIVYANQDGENQGGFSRDRLGQMAEAIGLDKAAFTTLLDDPDLIAAMKAETAEGVALNIDSTPTLVVNGVVKPGLPDWEQMQAIIAEALAAASPAAGSPVASTAP